MGGQCSDDGAIFVGNPATFSETDTGFINAIKARYYKLVRIDWVYGQEDALTGILYSYSVQHNCHANAGVISSE